MHPPDSCNGFSRSSSRTGYVTWMELCSNPTSRLVSSILVGRIAGSPMARPAGENRPIDDLITLNPASLELEGGVPLKTRPLWIGCPAQADSCVLTACTGHRTPRVRRNITPPGAELLSHAPATL